MQLDVLQHAERPIAPNPLACPAQGIVSSQSQQLNEWLVAWLHQAITWTSVDLPSDVYCGIHLRAIPEELLMYTLLKSHLPVAPFTNIEKL